MLEGRERRSGGRWYLRNVANQVQALEGSERVGPSAAMTDRGRGRKPTQVESSDYCAPFPAVTRSHTRREAPLIVLPVITPARPPLMVLVCHLHELVAERFAVFQPKRPSYRGPEGLQPSEDRRVR